MPTSQAAARTHDGGTRVVAGVLTAAAVGFVFWRAWVCDDAFITFRHVANCLAGEGPVFNIGERVQGFSHPLWFLLLLSLSTVLEPYAAAVTLGLLWTAAIVPRLAGFFGRGDRGLLCLSATTALLLSSRAFVQFQTSGLETSLSSFLIVVLFSLILSPAPVAARRGVFPISLLCSLLILNRPDFVVLCGPIALWSCVRALRSRIRGLRLPLILGFAPLAAWFVFATVYYGTPLPNTAYAKTGLPFWTALNHGRDYLQDYASHEPAIAVLLGATVPTATLVAVWDLRRRKREGGPLLAAALAVWLHVLYVTAIGGDFMRGRFLLPAIVGGAVLGGYLLRRWLPEKGYPRGSVLLLAAMGLFLAGGTSLGEVRSWEPLINPVTGIAEEHAIYAGGWYENRFREPLRHGSPEATIWTNQALIAKRYADNHGPIVYSHVAAGVFSYHAGPKVRVLDWYGLTDPFVARCEADAASRVGHIERFVPPAYFQARGAVDMLPDAERRLKASDGTLLQEAEGLAREARWPSPELRQRWQDIRTVISGPLFSRERLRRIPKYALGRS